ARLAAARPRLAGLVARLLRAGVVARPAVARLLALRLGRLVARLLGLAGTLRQRLTRRLGQVLHRIAQLRRDLRRLGLLLPAPTHLFHHFVPGVELPGDLLGVQTLLAARAFLGVRLGTLLGAGVGGGAGRLALALGLRAGLGVAALGRVLQLALLPGVRLGRA